MRKEILNNILMQEDVVLSINENMDTLLELIPEIKDAIGFEHKHPHHHLDVWNHTLCALSHSPFDFETRVILLLHDIGKPHSCQEGEIRHFKGHPRVSYTMSLEILKRLDFTNEEIELLSYLILVHDDQLTTEEINENKELSFKRFKVQYCDALAHHPDKLEARIAYLLKTNELLNEGKTKEDYNNKLISILNKKSR